MPQKFAPKCDASASGLRDAPTKLEVNPERATTGVLPDEGYTVIDS